MLFLGSFGHPHAKRAGLSSAHIGVVDAAGTSLRESDRKGLCSGSAVGAAETRSAVRRLNAIIVDTFIDEGVAAVGVLCVVWWTEVSS